MKISDREKKMLIFLVGLVICVAVYFKVFLVYIERADLLSAENSNLSKQVRELRQEEARLNEIEKQIQVMNLDIINYSQLFPGDVKEEDVLVFLRELENNTAIQIENFSISEKTPVLPAELNTDAEVTTQSEADSEVKELDETETTEAEQDSNGDIDETQDKDTLNLNKQITSINYKISYQDMNELFLFLRNYKKKVSIQMISSAFDQETGNIKGSLEVNVYSLEGPKRDYIPSVLESVEIGTSNIFKSGNSTEKKIKEEVTNSNNTKEDKVNSKSSKKEIDDSKKEKDDSKE